MPALSERLQCIAQCILPHEPMADIGTDHGQLPLWCLRTGLVPFAVLSDINEGPLQRAQALMQASEVSQSLYELRLGSGLSVLMEGEAASVVIAGMGGELIARILEADPQVTQSVKRFVFQPRKRSGLLRTWLWENGWRIEEDLLADERGRLCQIIAAEKGEQEPYEFADIPACEGPLMPAFLDREIGNIKIIYDNLMRSKDAQDRARALALQNKAEALKRRRDALCKKNNS